MERRRGFADLVFITKSHVDSPAIIIELKWKHDAETAIKQIKDNKYIAGLEGYHGKVLLVVISYDKLKRGETDKAKKHSCVIEEMEIL